MKPISVILVILTVLVGLCACSGGTLADMTTREEGAYCAIVWEDRTYVPYCAIDKGKLGEQLGIVDGDPDDRVYACKGESPEEWIINICVTHLMDGAMLCREQSVTNIPDGLESEYEWNP